MSDVQGPRDSTHAAIRRASYPDKGVHSSQLGSYPPILRPETEVHSTYARRFRFCVFTCKLLYRREKFHDSIAKLSKGAEFAGLRSREFPRTKESLGIISRPVIHRSYRAQRLDPNAHQYLGRPEGFAS